jgi:hypothetical protein
MSERSPVRARSLAVALATATLAAGSAAPCFAQVAIRPVAPTGDGPTTRILAIGRLTANADAAGLKGIMPTEVRETVQLYLKGKIDQWFVMTDQSGVVFILDCDDVDQARALLEKLPLGRARLMQFQLIPLGPLAPLGLLTASRSN